MSAMRRRISRDITFSRSGSNARSSKSRSPGNPANRTSGRCGSPLPRTLGPRCNLQSAPPRRGPRSLARTSRCSNALASTLHGMLIGAAFVARVVKETSFRVPPSLALPYQDASPPPPPPPFACPRTSRSQPSPREKFLLSPVALSRSSKIKIRETR